MILGLRQFVGRFLASKPQPIVTLNSQKGQDYWVIHDIFKGKTGGYFLEMGAADGMYLSNSLILERDYGWQGLCIEPNPTFFAKLQANRKCDCRNVCIDDQRGEVDFILAAEYGGIISEDTDNNSRLRSESLEQARTQGQVVTLPTMPLADVLRQAGAPKVIDYFSLDVEGAEERVLRYFPFDEFTFLTMSIERPTPLLNEMLLKKYGYIFVKNVRSDTFYIHRSLENVNQIHRQPFQQTAPKAA